MFDSLKKKTYGATSYGANGRPASFGERAPAVKPTKAQLKSLELIGWTPGPKGKKGRVARALWG
jgi:hypothetical protein